MYQLLAIDVDGTLLTSNHELRPRVRQAVRAAREQGLHVALATGKLLRSVAYLVEQRRLGSAYALMTLCQQVGWLAMNQAIGFSQDAFKAGPKNPAGYLPMLWILAGMSVAGIVFSLLLAHGPADLQEASLPAVEPGV